ncbi:cytochrome P450 monooxygenase [Exophiala viscosa]|uniref:cytochrome P450 monooxygenase n=1 Tax=Exophiala viscosa TaxID=2486360 RepID=UPI00219AF072|nr:cytochrome P450 monooxygenase [Exophiala viscosa]
MSWLAIILTLFALWLSSNLYGLLRNYLAARKTGLPLFLLPINIYNPIWMVTLVPLNPLFKRIFPSWLYESVDIGTYGFEVRLKSSLFEKTGPAFILVTSGPMEMSIIDPELIFEILKRPKDFPNTEISAVIMDIFGSSVLTTNGETWSRQRKLIAPNINEKISSLVFGESCRQAREMLSFYMDDVKGVTNDTMRGMKKVAINVLGTAGFGISRPWNDSEEATRSKGHRLTYMEATKIVVENIVTAAVLPAKLIVLPFFPKDMQDLGHAKNDFPILSSAMLANERKLQETTAEPRHNLMSMLVRFAESNDEKSAGTQYLSEEEIQGNLFIFTAAGFDTTANTMAYALAFLATFPKWQDWIYEEISQVVGDREVEYLEYADIFPRLPRCLALMFETMRLFPPLVHIARTTDKNHDVTITTSTRSYLIPRGTNIYISTVGLHRDKSTWGKDAQTFRPSRWIIDETITPDSPTSTIANLKTMPKGTFVPWSTGPRSCPGMKMSQVEFVSVFMTIFRRYRCEAVRLDTNETDEQVQGRFEAVMEDSAPRLTLQMNRNQDLKIRWIKR